jgi:hypothetical protein
LIQKKLIVAIGVLSCSLVTAQDYSFNPSKKTILDAGKGKELLKQCSRPTPQKVKDFWNLSDADVTGLEKYFKKIVNLNPERDPDYNKILDSLGNYSYQYIGVIINKKKYIYINAFKSSLEWNFKDWQTEPAKACDGPASFWGVLFDPEKLEFKEFKTNGPG